MGKRPVAISVALTALMSSLPDIRLREVFPFYFSVSSHSLLILSNTSCAYSQNACLLNKNHLETTTQTPSYSYSVLTALGSKEYLISLKRSGTWHSAIVAWRLATRDARWNDSYITDDGFSHLLSCHVGVTLKGRFKNSCNFPLIYFHYNEKNTLTNVSYSRFFYLINTPLWAET